MYIEPANKKPLSPQKAEYVEFDVDSQLLEWVENPRYHRMELTIKGDEKLKMQNSLNGNSNLKESNQKITYSGESIAMIIKELSYILCSLHDMGSYYVDKMKQMKQEYEKETTQFIDNSLVCHRLAVIRGVLSEPFDSEVGDDEMDDLERVCEDIPYWSKPGDFSTEMWIKWDESTD